MTVQQLIDKLTELVKINPDNANIEIRWYDDVKGHLHRGDGRPIQLYQNTITKNVQCVLNAVYNPPGYGMKLIPNNGKTRIV